MIERLTPVICGIGAVIAVGGLAFSGYGVAQIHGAPDVNVDPVEAHDQEYDGLTDVAIGGGVTTGGAALVGAGAITELVVVHRRQRRTS
jgi:hypothetical protein